MKNLILIVFCFFLVFDGTNSYAGGAVNKRQQMQKSMAQRKAMMQQQAQQQMQQQMQQQLQQQQATLQQAAEQQAYAMAKQKAGMMQQQVQQQAVQQAMIEGQKIHRATQQAVARVTQEAAAQIAAQTAYQAQRAQQIAAAQAMQQGKAVSQQIMQQAGQATAEAAQYAMQSGLTQPEQAQEIVSLDQVLSSLGENSHAWPLIIDKEAKEVVVADQIAKYREKRIYIKKSPAYYADMIDGMAQSDPAMFEQPFARVLEVMAVLEYDFDNGRNKDAMAIRVLGTADAVDANKKRLGLR